jgi:PTH1 family peptidyl-tRNA hydrolase
MHGILHTVMIYTIVPLGNPGEKYARTRHNAGRVILSYVLEDVTHHPECEIHVPKTFMNESGKDVSGYLRFHEGRELVVVYDDKDLPIGTLRISFDRGDGGHNGVKSIIEALGRTDFIRIRIGIAPAHVDGIEHFAPHGEAVQGYVLGHLRDDEIERLKELSSKFLGAITTIVEKGYMKAMEVYN